MSGVISNWWLRQLLATTRLGGGPATTMTASTRLGRALFAQEGGNRGLLMLGWAFLCDEGWRQKFQKPPTMTLMTPGWSGKDSCNFRWWRSVLLTLDWGAFLRRKREHERLTASTLKFVDNKGYDIGDDKPFSSFFSLPDFLSLSISSFLVFMCVVGVSWVLGVAWGVVLVSTWGVGEGSCGLFKHYGLQLSRGRKWLRPCVYYYFLKLN